MGNWNCEYELSNLWARGILDTSITETPDSDEFAGRWHLSADEFDYGTKSSGEAGQIVGAATNNTFGSTITNGAGSCPKLAADYVRTEYAVYADKHVLHLLTINILYALLKLQKCSLGRLEVW